MDASRTVVEFMTYFPGSKSTVTRTTMVFAPGRSLNARKLADNQRRITLATAEDRENLFIPASASAVYLCVAAIQ